MPVSVHTRPKVQNNQGSLTKTRAGKSHDSVADLREGPGFRDGLVWTSLTEEMKLRSKILPALVWTRGMNLRMGLFQIATMSSYS